MFQGAPIPGLQVPSIPPHPRSPLPTWAGVPPAPGVAHLAGACPPLAPGQSPGDAPSPVPALTPSSPHRAPERPPAPAAPLRCCPSSAPPRHLCLVWPRPGAPRPRAHPRGPPLTPSVPPWLPAWLSLLCSPGVPRAPPGWPSAALALPNKVSQNPLSLLVWVQEGRGGHSLPRAWVAAMGLRVLSWMWGDTLWGGRHPTSSNRLRAGPGVGTGLWANCPILAHRSLRPGAGGAWSSFSQGPRL